MKGVVRKLQRSSGSGYIAVPRRGSDLIIALALWESTSSPATGFEGSAEAAMDGSGQITQATAVTATTTHAVLTNMVLHLTRADARAEREGADGELG